MPRKPTAGQIEVLLTVYSAHAKFGWTPHRKWERAEAACAKRLCTAGLLGQLPHSAEPTYEITASGRALLGLDSIQQQRPLRATIRDGLRWLGFNWRDCEINIGEDQPVFRFDQETVDLRSARFTIDVYAGGGPFREGALQILAKRHLYPYLEWEALARYVSERGYPSIFRDHDSGELVFWRDEMPAQLESILAVKGQICMYREVERINLVLVTDVTPSRDIITFRMVPSTTHGFFWNFDAPLEFFAAATWRDLSCSQLALTQADGDWCIAFEPTLVGKILAFAQTALNEALVIVALNRLLLADDGAVDDWSI